MTCSACQHENRPGAAFCEECGARLERRCPSCGDPCAPAAKFCSSCGTSLAARPAQKPDEAVARKVVTIVFADLIGSTALHERLDPESVSRLMDRYHRTVRAAVEAHRGTVVQLLGDGVMCAFGVPHVAEDDAIRAVRAAFGIQRAFREFAREESAVAGKLGLRVAVNTGEVVVSDEYAAGIGDPLNVAARLQQEAHDGDVLIGESTQRLVRELVTLAPFGVLSLKGRSETVATYRVVSLDRPAGVPATGFVGREDELRRLMAVYDTACAGPGARLVAILGSPGLGKSRLLSEFGRRLGDRTTVLIARCDAAGGATFAPLAEALRTLLRIDDGASGDSLRTAIDAVMPSDESERARIAAGVAALLAATPAPPEETFFVVRRLLAALATAQPVVLAIDDLQWAEPLLLDLTEHLVQWSTGVPLLVLVAARPELRDTRSSLAAPGGLVSDVVTLHGLDAGAATRLAANVIGADELPAAVAGRVLSTSEGNPLFVGELVRMLVQDGTLKREGDRWIAGVELARLEMPPTIQALLAARIERLRPEERTVLERAAVVGRQFSRAAVAHLLPGEAGNLDARLESLRRSELVEPDTGWFLGEPALRFHHVLIRDAAYRRVLKNTRADLHARFADWLQARVGEAVEHDETLGWHLEQAHQHLRELGPIDEKGRALGERAARYLAAAGRRALARDDLPLAASLLGRALDRLDAADPARADLALDWCEALLSAGDVGPAAGAIEELGRFTGTSERLRAWHTCFAGELAALTDPQALRATSDAVAAAAETLASLDDAAGEAKAHFVQAVALARLGRVGACEAALDRALAAARRGGDRRRSNAVLAGAPLAALWGPSPVTRASGRCLDVVRVLRITQGAPAVEAVALRCQGVLEALRGRTEAARRMIASSRRMVEELGITRRLLEADMFAGLIELLEGDAVAAERSLRAAYEGLRGQGLGIDAAQAAALLGRSLLAQGRAAEAETLSHESEALAGDDLQAAIAWRGVRAEALARRGEHGPAVEFARAALELAAATDSLLYHADARLALAAALRAAGRSGEAAAEEARAIELWEAKGATLLAERARRGVGRVEPARVPDEARPVRRRVGTNAATVIAARIEAAIAARDFDALPPLVADGMETVHHATGLVYDREGALDSWRGLLRAQNPTLRLEPLATLGDSLALYRSLIAGSRFIGRKFDVGAYETNDFVLFEADARGQLRRHELFPADRLGDAVARLYERYAELLPDGAARARAAAMARFFATGLGAFEPDRYAAGFAPTVEAIDHRKTIGWGSVRGVEAFLTVIRAQLEVADQIAHDVRDVLALGPDGFLVRWINFGTARVGGGAFERHFLGLWVFGPDGLATRIEIFDSDDEDVALARFDELMREPPPARFAAAPVEAAKKRGRRVRPNAATANAGRIDAAIAARDADALSDLIAERAEAVDHSGGTVYDRQGMLATARAVMRGRDVTCRHDPLATLGDSLALCRVSVSARGVSHGKFEIGPYEDESIHLPEVDAQGRRCRDERFAADRLYDAIVRLYERYAELLPDGPARTRAAATARSVATGLGPFDPDRYAATHAPAVEAVDHRMAIGWGSVRGVDAFLEVSRSLLEVAAEFETRVDDILALRSDAFLVRWRNFGTARVGGGAYERHFIVLQVFGPDGLVTRVELFDSDREHEALARFDELTAAAPSPAAKKGERRVRPNAATAQTARLDAAIAARDGAAVPTLYADGFEAVDHTTGSTFERAGVLAMWGFLLRAKDPRASFEPLATLGDSLALCRWSMSASAFAGGKFDVGPYGREEIHLVEVDAQGQQARMEAFAAARLGDAVARLYERYAELLPDGPARTRAAAAARSVAAMAGPFDLERLAAAFAPAVEDIDHRTLGTWSGRGAEALLENYRSWRAVADDPTLRDDEVLALESDALLVRQTHSGTDRAGGGVYERPFLLLWVFGADGLVARQEQFDPDRDDEALARFDELTVAPAVARSAAIPRKRDRRLRANAAAVVSARLEAAAAARDPDPVPAMLADHLEVVDHTTGATYDREGYLATWRAVLGAERLTYRQEHLATLGESLVLYRASTSAKRFTGRKFDVGPYEREQIVLAETDAEGRLRREETFAADRLRDAVVRLYERHADLLPDGPGRARAAATALSVATVVDPDFSDVLLEQPDRSRLAPDVEFVDQRTVGLGLVHGAGAVLRAFRAMIELQEHWTWRLDDILGLRSDAVLVRWTHSGTDRAGGAFERRLCLLWVFGVDGLITRGEQFDAEREEDALARFDELTGTPAAVRFPVIPRKRGRRVRANAAIANAARLDAAVVARDTDALSALLADELEAVEHGTAATYDRRGLLASWRSLMSAQGPACRHEPLATLGDSLALLRQSLSASSFAGRKFDVGAYETEHLLLVEVDAQGRRRRNDAFPVERLGDAVVRLYERYAELLPDGPARARAAATARSVTAVLQPGEIDSVAAVLAPGVEFVDERTVGLGVVHGAEAMLRAFRAIMELQEDWSWRLDDVLGLRSDALLVRSTNSGTLRASGGAYERRLVLLWVFGTDGLLTRWEQFDTEREDEALARFDELTAEPAAAQIAAVPSLATKRRERRVRSNAATAHAARFDAAMAARDADSLPTLFADEYEVVDHTTGITYDRQGHLVSLRGLVSARDLRFRHEPLATLGDSLALCRVSWSASAFAGRMFDVGAYESEHIGLVEVDAHGHGRRVEQFAADQLADAIVRLYERYAGLLPDGPARARAAATARGVACMAGALDLERWAAFFAPDIDFFDPRTVGLGRVHGADAVLRAMRALFDLLESNYARLDDILALRSDALLVRWTHFGTERAGGGAFERALLVLWVFGADGRLTRWEQCDAERADAALARFDELGVEPAAARIAAVSSLAVKKRERRVRSTAATAQLARSDAAIAARDADTFLSLFADEYELLDHTTGVTYDRQGEFASCRALLSARDPTHRLEPLATLGDSLVLGRVTWSASGFAGRTFDVGAYETEYIRLVEVDAEGRSRRAELFAVDRLGDAIVRLYERYADLLPDGLARARAVATARSTTLLLGAFGVDRYAAAFSPAVEAVDHRTLGTWSARGSEALLEHFRAVLGLVDAPATRVEDILCLQPDAWLGRGTHFGTARAGGGAYERQFLLLWVFGTDGLVTRWEWFDADRDDEALARFDEVTAGPTTGRLARPAKKRERRVRSNAATAYVARIDAAVASRDADALPTLHADEYEAVDHTTGVTFDRQGVVASFRGLVGARDPRCLHEPLATLGDSLALCRQSTSASAFVGRTFDVGAYEREEIQVIEVDAQGRGRRHEIFAVDRLAHAIVRLYERYADLLSDGPARVRAAATARSVATMLRSYDLDRWATAIAPALEFVDHRSVGFESTRGAEAFLRGIRSLLELATDIAIRVDDVLCLRPDAVLISWAESGMHRASGGLYERHFLLVWIFDAHGLLTRIEGFDVERDGEALARFDELTAEPPVPRPTRRVRPNTAAASVARFVATVAARDADALLTLLGDEAEVLDHTTGTTWDRQGWLTSWRALLRAEEPTCRHEPLATLGESLALYRISMSARSLASANFDVGPYEREEIALSEVDANGRLGRTEIFAPDRLGDAVGRLYARYAELLPEGPARIRAAATARSAAASLEPFDLDRFGATLASTVESVDHRTLGTWSARGAEAFLGHFRSVLELADDAATRDDDVLGLQPDAFLVRRTHFGTARAGGGPYERPYLVLHVFGVDGLLTRVEHFDVDRDDEALACFDELTTTPGVPRIENAATRLAARITDAWVAHDWERFAAFFPASFRVIDHRMHLELDRDEMLDSFRPFFASLGRTSEVLATRGDRLSLVRLRFEGTYGLSGPSEIEMLNVNEVGAGGDHVAAVAFNPDDLDAAYAELDDRYAAGEAAAYGADRRDVRAFGRAVVARDWDVLAARLAPDLVVTDHRPLGWETMHGSAAYVESLKSLVDLAPDVRHRVDHVILSARSTLLVATWVGTREGGAFEAPRVVVSEFDGLGRACRLDFYNLDQLDEARARFAQLRPDPLRIPPNAATRACDRVQECVETQSWDALRALCAPVVWEDRRRLIRTTGDCDMLVASCKLIARAKARLSPTLLATAGDRLALHRHRWTGVPEGVVFEAESLQVTEVDAEGRIVADIDFDLYDRRAASLELLDRYARSETSRWAPAVFFDFRRALIDHDLDRMRAALPDDFVFHDHRRTGVGRIDGADDYVAWLAVLFELSPDAIIEPMYEVATAKHGALAVGHTFGTLAEGGAFESIFVQLAVFHGERPIGAELFELEDLDVARARFEELRPDPLRIPPNTASRVRGRINEAFAARDWPTVRAFASDDFVYEDRRKRDLLTGGVELWIKSIEFQIELGLRFTRELLATVGDRIALERYLWTGEPDGVAVEGEILVLTEVDANGRLATSITFDLDDRRAAFAEAEARFAAGEAAAVGGQAPFAAFGRAFAERDWEALRGCLAHDAVVHDRRTLIGLGELHHDEFIESRQALADLAPDAAVEPLRILVWNPHGRVSVWRKFGTVRDGGPFEDVFVGVYLTDGDRIQRYEAFDVGDVDRALARFEELCAGLESASRSA